jgi:murein DD-endopeptidase MepM/ murein hydrolase activator NlpD
VTTPAAEAAILEAPVLEPPAAPAGSGRRRKAAASVAPTAEAVSTPVQPPASIAPGSGRRRRVSPCTPVVDPTPAEVIVSVQPTPRPIAEVVPIEVGHRHRAGSRHRAANTSTIPGNPALVAGAAAVAIAAVGALATTTGGIGFGTTGTDLAGASTLAMAKLPQAPATDPSAARASRDKARGVLAARLQQQANQSALAKALKLAQLRATRLAALAKEFFLPVHAYHLTAGFGEGGGLWSHGHTGQDFACPTGTQIHALASGTVVFSGWDGAYGWKTIERLADGTEIWYAHQSRIIVHSGPVVAGQLIGLVGSTGNTTGPHLHLEVHPGGGPAVDPMPWLRAHGMHP